MKKPRLFITAILLTIFCAAALVGCSLADFGALQQTTTPPEQAQVYYLDVGQGDCELMRLPTGETVLIDAGTKAGSDALIANLKRLGVQKIDILIATHPHADHIGGMEQVVQSFAIGEIYMPEIADDQVPTTATYTKLLQAISAKNMRINRAKPGTTILQTEQAKLEIIAPNNSDYKNLNNYSVVTKLTYGKTRFLFTGDAEKESENEMLSAGYDLTCEVLKIGHHGSATSSSAKFLNATAPQTAVISCGKDNDYGHPHAEILNRLKKNNITVYRTDRNGTILIESNGNTYKVKTD